MTPKRNTCRRIKSISTTVAIIMLALLEVTGESPCTFVIAASTPIRRLEEENRCATLNIMCLTRFKYQEILANYYASSQLILIEEMMDVYRTLGSSVKELFDTVTQIT